MKKIALLSAIFSLILFTAIIKNTATKIEDELFTVRENLRVLKSEYENILLEHDYLSSAEKLIKFQSLYFEDQLIQKSIKNIKIYNISKNEKNIKELKIMKE
jgi:virulence-associated protein VapD|tara:strand:- start:221 stop:526 length:306 start_codon:yes stop_codon:yes gene_type:complete